jgi:hypothetical protein
MRKTSAKAAFIAILALCGMVIAPAANARNTPIAPIQSTTSYIVFEQEDTLYTDDGLDLSFPTFDFGGEDIEVEISQNIGSQTITFANAKLPSGFVVTGFDSDDTYIETYGDTICNTDNWSLSYDSNGVTAKNFTCSAADGTVEFRFDVDDLEGYITSTLAGSYSIESQIRTSETRRTKLSAYVVETQDLITLVVPD